MSAADSFPRASAWFRPLRVAARTGSTNADLLAVIDRPGAAPEFSAIASLDQHAGRGRRGRIWSAEPGTVLAVSVALRPAAAGIPRTEYGGIPLVVGLAVREAVSGVAGATRLKWPNDVRIGGKKVAGILCEVSASLAVVAGVGINLDVPGRALQRDGALLDGITALNRHSASPVESDPLLASLGEALHTRWEAFRGAGGSLSRSGLLAEYRECCESIGASVRIELSGGRRVVGDCVDVDQAGRIVIDAGDGPVAYTAGDVVHLRPSDSPPSRAAQA